MTLLRATDRGAVATAAADLETADAADDLGLFVVDVHPALTVDEQADRQGDRSWERDLDACCGLCKTTPLRAALQACDGWASGVRWPQTARPSAASTSPAPTVPSPPPGVTPCSA